jgi:hypothetical protein
MTSQVTNRRERGFTSCLDHSQKFPTFTWKELENGKGGSKTAWCTDYWWRECPGRGWRWRESKKSNKPPSHPECTKMAKNRLFPIRIDLKITENAVFYLKVLNKIYFRDAF